MPQIQMIDSTPRKQEPTGVQEFFSKLASSYKEKQEEDTIGNILAEYGQNMEDARAYQTALNKLQRAPISPIRKAQEIKTLQDQERVLIERDKALNARYEKELAAKQKQSDKEKEVRENELILEKGGFSPEEIQKLAPNISTATARDMAKPEKSPNGPREKFEQILATEAAKEVPVLTQEIAKSRDLLDNIDTAEKIANENLRGPLSYAKAFLNTESASELTTLGATNLGSVIKLFNPAGTLPQAKLEWIRKTFSVSPYDTISTMKGKFNTQRIILNQAKARAEQRLKLIKENYGNIPAGEIERFDQETSDLLDAMKDELEPKMEEEAHKGMVQVADPKGRLRWVPEELAKKLKAK